MDNQQQTSLATNTANHTTKQFQLLELKFAQESKIKNICIVVIIVIIVSNYFQVRSLKENYINLQDLIGEIAKNLRQNRQNIQSQTNFRIGNMSELRNSLDKRFTEGNQKMQSIQKSLTTEAKKIGTKMIKFQESLNSIRKEFDKVKKTSISSTTGSEIVSVSSTFTQRQQTYLTFLMNQVKQQFHQFKTRWLKSMLNQEILSKNEKAKSAFLTSFANIKLNHENVLIDDQNARVQKSIRERLEKDYNLNNFKTELPFCIIVPTYNNAKNFRYEYNLQSILNLNYKNYKVVIIDDASTDGTYELLSDFISKQKSGIKISLLRNEMKMTAVPNINKAIRQYCGQGDIAVLVDGDDQLLVRDSLRVFNSIYQSKDVDVVYSNHLKLYWHQNNVYFGWSQAYQEDQIKDNAFRDVPQKISHLRSFRVSLFLQIKQQDLKDQSGSWFQSTYDEVICLPILQMSCGRIAFVQQFFYLYNFGIGTNDLTVDKDKQKQIADFVKNKKKKYSCLKHDK